MYKDLGLTDEQQRQYERNYRTIMGTSDRKSKKDEQQSIVEHNSLMNAVLIEAQYSIVIGSKIILLNWIVANGTN